MWVYSYPEVSLADLDETYDFIIVGGGTSGCVLANRLSQDANVTVLLLEKGKVSNDWKARTPLTSFHFISDGSRSEVIQSVPQKHLSGRKIDLIVGSSLGGTSKINGMVYTRGFPQEFDAWSKEGRKGWGYNDLLPYFVKSEGNLTQDASKYHGKQGEWSVRAKQTFVWQNSSCIIQASEALGIPYIDDINALDESRLFQQGCAKIHHNMHQNGERASTLSTFLPLELAQSRRNHLHICTNTVVDKLFINTEGDTPRATGIYVRSSEGPNLIRARKEIILSAGAFASPRILMLSGIGPEGHLKEHDITVIKNLPGVGSHLQDHFSIPTEYNIPLEDSILKYQYRPWLLLLDLIYYFLFGTGFFLLPFMEVGVFAQSGSVGKLENGISNGSLKDTSIEELADIEVVVFPSGRPGGGKSKNQSGKLCFYPALLRPTSKGTVRLSSSNPSDPLIIDPNYMSTAKDRALARKILRFSHTLKEKMSSLGYHITDSNTPVSYDDKTLDEFAFGGNSWTSSTWHFTSTCRMAPDNAEEQGVVDDELKVHGIEGLRVADASIFPSIISVHPAAAAVVVAEKCADMCRKEYGLI
ncbi:hypothetical protein C8Q75DRAFT_506562 [Abortiporus biennis]|nr:hypothetical protein C8Q75DRAFT_506562 [Abortiporus biennis]